MMFDINRNTTDHRTFLTAQNFPCTNTSPALILPPGIHTARCKCRPRAIELAAALKASKLVPMPNGEGDFGGLFGNVIAKGSSLEEFLQLAEAESLAVMIAKPAEALSVWP